MQNPKLISFPYHHLAMDTKKEDPCAVAESPRPSAVAESSRTHGITNATLRAQNNYDYYKRRSYSERPTHGILHDYRRDPSCSVSPSSADVSDTRSNTRRRRNRRTKNIPKVGMKSHTSAVADRSCGREPQSPRRYRGSRSEHDYAIRRSDVRR